MSKLLDKHKVEVSSRDDRIQELERGFECEHDIRMQREKELYTALGDVDVQKVMLRTLAEENDKTKAENELLKKQGAEIYTEATKKFEEYNTERSQMFEALKDLQGCLFIHI